MDRCPPELQIKIFTLACTDGGRTGCALSLVSRPIRATSSLVRFYTVSLNDILRMRLFLETVRNQNSCPNVTHLFLYDGGREGRPYFGENALAVVTSIISTLSPFLRTISGSLAQVGATYLSLFPPATDLPFLQELSLNVGDVHGSDVVLSNLPRLRWLHKWGQIHGWESMVDVDAVIRIAPKLAQIRLSGLNQAPMVPIILDAAFKRGSPQVMQDEEVPKLRLPNALEQLLVQCASMDDRGWCGTGSLVQCNMQVKLSLLAMRHEEMIILPEHNYAIGDCMKDWLEMIEGREGWCRIRRARYRVANKIPNRIIGSKIIPYLEE